MGAPNSKKGNMAKFGIAMTMLLSAFLGGCANQMAQSHGGSGTESGIQPKVAGVPVLENSNGGKRFSEPDDLDKLLDAKPMVLASVKPTTQSTNTNGSAGTSETKNPEVSLSGKSKFRIQISAEADIDAAQSKKALYEKQLGGSVDMVFDAPYYKLRWGFFDSKQDAEDKLLELSDKKIQGFVVKQ